MIKSLFQLGNLAAKQEKKSYKTVRRSDGTIEKDISEQGKILEEHWLDQKNQKDK